MAASVDDTPSPIHLNKDPTSLIIGSSSPPLFSPSSDQRFWSNFRTRIDTLMENQRSGDIINESGTDRAKRLKEDSLLLLRGFDSVADSLSLLSNDIDNALQGANELAEQPTLTEILHRGLINPECKQQQQEEEVSAKKNGREDGKRALKRRLGLDECSEKHDDQESSENENKRGVVDGHLKRAKLLAVSMATKASSLARELKSVKSDLGFMEERYVLVDEENRMLRDGIDRGIRPEEDDLVRLQLEALLAQKSRLASQNANLLRENQCLHQLVDYHQAASQNLSASYEQVIEGLCLDFTSPPRSIPEGDEDVNQTP